LIDAVVSGLRGDGQCDRAYVARPLVRGIAGDCCVSALHRARREVLA
jgi:hypothetical protein